MPQRNGGSRPWRRTVAHVLRRDGHICWICGGPNADSADHVIPVAHGGTDHPTNLRAVHHANPPHCNRYRNAHRTAGETLDRVTKLGLVDTNEDLTW